MKSKDRLSEPATKKDLDDLAVQIIGAITKTLEEWGQRFDLKLDSLEKRLTEKIEHGSSETSDIRRRVIDLETESATRHDLEEHKRVGHVRVAP